MGYYTFVHGEIKIQPPVTIAEMARMDFLDDNSDIGLHTPVSGESTLFCQEDDEFKAYTLIQQVQQVVDALPGRTFSGHLDCEGEEAADLWRVVVRDGKAVKVVPRIVWPDED